MGFSPLSRPLKIADQQWPVDTVPLVSILCSAYNHAAFIRQCIDGFLMQETTFPVEILVRDDASPDGTATIIDEYRSKYPHLFRCIFESENQYVKGARALEVLTKKARGKYSAICEGDDYWTAPDKLEKQITLLQDNPESYMCAARTRMVFDDVEDTREDILIEGLPKKSLTFTDFYNKCYLHTSTYVLRSFADVQERWGGRLRMSDTSLRYIYADMGPVLLLPEEVSVYRITGKGTWTSLNDQEKLRQEINIHELFFKYFKPQYREAFAMKLLIQHKDGMFLHLKQKNLRGFVKYGMGFIKYCILKPLALCKLAGRTVQRFSGCSA